MAEWLLPNDRRWREALRDVEYDFYHLPCYAEVTAENGGGAPRAYYDDRQGGTMLIPLLVRDVSLHGAPLRREGAPVRDAVSPYGYASPLCGGEMQVDKLKAAFSGFIEAGAEAGLVTTFLRLHPLLSEKIVAAIRDITHAVLTASGATVSIDLTQSENKLDAELSLNHRRNIKKLSASGFTANVDDWNEYPSFQRLYAQTMRRVGADDSYRFGESYFDRLRACLGDVLHMCTVRSASGEVVCGGLFTRVGRIVQYHLGATADDYTRHAPSKLMFYVMRKWAQSAGAGIFHLGGGVGGKRDSLFEFKYGFATHVHPFHTVRIVHNASVYEELTRQWLNNINGGMQRDQEYFPSYRRSVVAEQIKMPKA